VLNTDRRRLTTGILVVDDHPVVREGTAVLIRGDPTLRLVGYARNGVQALLVAERTRPDLVLLDLRLPDMLAPEGTQALKRLLPEVKVLVFTAYADHAALDAAMVAGADGCVLKDASGTDLLTSIRRVAGGEVVIDPRIHHDPDPSPARHTDLTAREYDVLRRVALGETNPEIAVALTLSRNTVKSYLQSAMQKLGARNRIEAIVRARDAGLL